MIQLTLLGANNLKVRPVDERLAAATLIQRHLSRVEFEAVAEVRQLAIPRAAPRDEVRDSEFGRCTIHRECDLIAAIPVPDWLSVDPRNKVDCESIEMLGLHGLTGAVGNVSLLFFQRPESIKDSEVLSRIAERQPSATIEPRIDAFKLADAGLTESESAVVDGAGPDNVMRGIVVDGLGRVACAGLIGQLPSRQVLQHDHFVDDLVSFVH